LFLASVRNKLFLFDELLVLDNWNYRREDYMKSKFILMAAALAAAFLAAACDMGGGERDVYCVAGFSAGEGGGQPPLEMSVPAGTGITLPGQGSMTAPLGKTFAGWKSPGGSVYPAGAKVIIAADTTFTAVWTEEDAPPDDGGTYARFINQAKFPVYVYKDSARLVETALVPASGKKWVKTEAASMGTAFYPCFQITVDGYEVFTQDGPAITVRVDEGKVTNITIPPITAVSTTTTCIKVENKSIHSLTFTRKGYELSPLGTNSPIVMPGETAVYAVEAGPASGYAFMRNASDALPFPADISGASGFVSGKVYVFSYAGSLALTDVSDVLEYRSKYTVTFDAGGGSPATQTRTIESDATAGLNMPSEPTRSGYAFGGWYTARNGGGSEFTASTPVTANVTVYAKWTAAYTVTFNADGGDAGGSPGGLADEETRTVVSGGSVGASYMPSAPTKSGYVFGGWYTARNGGGSEFTGSTVVTANMTVYARWVMQLPSGLTLEGSLTWISNNAVEGGVYTITLNNNESIAPKTLSYDGRNIGVILEGGAAGRTISLSTSGSLFTVGSGVTLTLGSNVTLQGRAGNTVSLVRVYGDGTLVMNAGSKIDDNAISSSSSYGGGVNVGYNSTFEMFGGEISGNAFAFPSPNSSEGGGGVYVYRGSAFAMNGGKISGNTASSDGGGVYVNGDGAFTMSDGEISGNSGGSGVYVGSKYTGYDGGHPDKAGAFTMSGGEISGNTASDYGGGVYVLGGTFTKQLGAVIYGSNASAALKNTARGDSFGHAAYVNSDKKRNTTAGTDVILDSSKGGW
jgi:uncharacterized repeat protein (TIGR02543 family)